jgi:uncharacterized membrane protein YhaH (DUF805 family)
MSKLPNSYEPVEPVNSINWWKWFIGFDGRINRSGLIVRVLIFPMLSFVSTRIEMLRIFWAFDGEAKTLILFISWLFILLALVLGIPACICGLVRRFHDKGESGWRALLLLIPIWNLVVLCELFFRQGELISNEFGTPPLGLRVG